jgi:uncharacterized protein YecE (DUF72 family)
MPHVHAGAQLERAPGPRYVARLRFAEIALRAPLPRAATLHRWRATLPEGFALALVAPKSSVVSAKGPLRFDDALEAGFAWLCDAAEALAAQFVVIPTPASLTTGQRDRELLAAYVERLRARAPERTVVWSPTGLWEPDSAQAFAARLGIVCAFDPLESPAPSVPVAYARLAAIGGRQRFSDPILRDLVDILDASDAGDIYVAIASPQSFQQATRLAQIANSSTPSDDDVLEGEEALDADDDDDDDADDDDDDDDDDADDDADDDDDDDDADDDDDTDSGG